MIKALELENFKAFGVRRRIEFAPITLIFGENSAGKSSVLSALNLLKQTRMSRDQDALLLPRTDSGLVDLGSFHELLHDHDTRRTLVLRLDFEPARRRPVVAQPHSAPSIGFEVGFKRQHEQSDVTLAYLAAHHGNSTSGPVVRYEPKELPEHERRALGRMPPYYPYWRGSRRIRFPEVRVASCVHVTSAADFWRATFREVRAEAPSIVEALHTLSERITQRVDGEHSLFSDTGLSVQQAQIEDAVAFYRSDFTIDQYVERRAKAELGGIVILDGFVPLPARGDVTSDAPEDIALRNARDVRHRLRRDSYATECLLEAGRELEYALEQMFPLGPYRRAPERLYIFTGTTPRDVGYTGSFLPDLLYRKPRLVEEANRWLDRLQIGYHIKIQPVGTTSNDLFELRLADTRRATSATVALADVGFGISQVLPFIVQTLASKEQTITIEQPEVHVHPRLQADLGDLLIAGIQPGRNHRFIIETHSEHVILRLLRRIRETSEGRLGDGEPRLTPDQVSVVYLERGPEGAEVHHLRVDGTGEFVDSWPRGFFEERAMELF